MNREERTERRLRELFTAARREDRTEAPRFRALLHRGRSEGGVRSAPNRAFRIAALGTAASLAVAATAAWLVLRTPVPAPVVAVHPVGAGEAVAAPAPLTALQNDPTHEGTAAGSSPVSAPEDSSPEPAGEPSTPESPTQGSRERPSPASAGAGPERLPKVEAPVAPVAAPPSPELPAEGGTSAPAERGVAAVPRRLDVHVVDSGGPLPGATVTLSSATGPAPTRSALTNARGVAKFRAVQPGDDYSVEVSFPGFANERVSDLRVGADKPLPLTVELKEQIVERGTVTAMNKLADLEQSSPAAQLSDQFVQNRPVPGRFYQNVLTLAPGGQDADGDGSPDPHGSRSRDFQAVVGGVSNVDPLSGQYMSRVNPNSIEAMEVITSGAYVELGRAERGFSRLAGEKDGSEFNTESYDLIRENDFLTVKENPLSTFSIDVDTASYSNVRRFLNQGLLPPRDAVRIEELVNYFHYDYPAPGGGAPFSASVEIADCPWQPDHRLARIGLKGEEITRGELAGTNLVFLIDVSGSMQPPNKLPLLKSALSLLVEQLDARDQVAIVVYAGASGLVLQSTPGDAKSEILAALDRLEAGGSTNGGSGLRLAYKAARQNFIPGGINRVILATDGDFNVGITDRSALLRLIEKDAAKGIFLTALGFGMGDYQDNTLETLADRGNGSYAYLDSLREARKVLVEEIGGTLVTIAKDVKIQIEFNPAEVAAYRLIGYENRMLRKEEFNDDTKDAGEIGAGHTVTALYEIVPPGTAIPVPSVDPLKYQKPPASTEEAESGELLTLKIRYKDPDGEQSRLLEFPIVDVGLALDQASADFKFAAAVAEFGLMLRDSRHKAKATFEDARALALQGVGEDERGYRAEFVDLVDRAVSLAERP